MVDIVENNVDARTDEGMTLDIPVRMYSPLEHHCPLLREDGLPESMVEFVEHAIFTLMDKDAGKLLVTGPERSGKSFFISEVIANFVHYYMSLQTQKRMKFIYLSLPDSHKISELLEKSSVSVGLGHYPALVADSLGIHESDLCIITEDVDFAGIVASAKSPARVILELNNSTFNVIQSSQNSGQTNVWSSWMCMDTSDMFLPVGELVDFVYKSLRERVADTHSLRLRKSLVSNTIKYVRNQEPGVFSTDGDSGEILEGNDIISIVPPAFFALIAKRANLILSQVCAGRKATKRDVSDALRKAYHTYDYLIDVYMDPKNVHPTELDGIVDSLGNLVAVEDIVLNADGVRPQVSGGKKKPVDFVGFSSMKTFEKRLLKNVIGQDTAVSHVASSLLTPAAGIQKPERPLRTFLFLGPTGVGKTQMSLSIADELLEKPMHVVRLDMSEYAQAGSDQKLFGTSPGYIGYNEEGGELTREVDAHPQSMIILDEVEKADPKIWNVFLQVFDAGRLTTGSGKVVDFSHTVIIMTSNLGAKEMLHGRAGFVSIGSSEKSSRADVHNVAMRAVEGHFTPEFINRIDDIVVFDKLDKDSAKQIVYKEIEEFSSRIVPQGKRIARPSAKVVDTILQLSNFEKYGARDIQRTINRLVATPLAKELLYNPNKKSFSLSTVEDTAVVVK